MTGWLAVVCHEVFADVLAYLSWFAGITRIPASSAKVFTPVMPVAALVLSAVVLAEPIGWPQLSGCGFVPGGIVLISRS